MICGCGDRHNDHAPELSWREPCLKCNCSGFNPPSEAELTQIAHLMETSCLKIGLFRGLPHLLLKTHTRRVRDLFRRRVWWRCHFCDLQEEVVRG